jgi:hypothetical protein
MARPRKPPADLRSETIRFTATPAEYVRIHQNAAAAGLSLSDFARKRVLSGKTVLRQTRALEPDLYDQLRRIGVNLNQAVRFLHAFKEVPPELAATAAAVEQFLTEHLADDRQDHG